MSPSSQFVKMLILSIVFFVPLFYLVSFLKSKVSADLQARVGPNRTRLAGFFQSIYDFIKLNEKEISLVSKINQILFLVMFALIFSVIPLVQFKFNVLFPVLILFLISFVSFLIGLKQKDAYLHQFALGYALQSAIGLLPILIVLLSVMLTSGTLSVDEIVKTQGIFFWDWHFLSNVFLFFGGVIFFVSGLVFLHLPPFNGLFSYDYFRQGLEGRFSGYYYSILKLRTEALQLFWIIFCVSLFWGAGNYSFDQATTQIGVLYFLTISIKSILIFFILNWFEKMTPKLKTIQISSFVLKVLLPMSFVTLIGVTLCL